MKFAFFVVMGGYALDIAPEDPNVLPWTITPKTFIRLYREGKIRDSDLDAKQIDDKTNADGVGKCIVCIQALVGLPSVPRYHTHYADYCSGLLPRG